MCVRPHSLASDVLHEVLAPVLHDAVRDAVRCFEQTSPTIYLSPENFDEVTEGGALCDDKGELSLEVSGRAVGSGRHPSNRKPSPLKP